MSLETDAATVDNERLSEFSSAVERALQLASLQMSDRPTWTLGDPAKVARYVGQVVHSVTHGDEWADMLRRCRRGDVEHIYVVVDREPTPSDTLRVGVYAPIPGAPDLVEKFKESFAQGRAGEIVEEGREFEAIDREATEPDVFAEVDVFDVGTAVVQAVKKMKKTAAQRKD